MMSFEDKLKPYYEHAGIQIFHGDCREILPQLPKGWCSTCSCELADEEVLAIHLAGGHEVGSYMDLVLTDPPYGIDACNMTLGAGKKEFHRGDWDGVRPDISPALGVGKWACVWGGNYWANTLPLTNDWLIWHKLNDERSFGECELAWTNYGKQTRHISHHWAGEGKQHPTQKPRAVIKWSLALCPDPCKSVIDPYMGSGTTLIAATDSNLRAIGIEIEEKYCEIAAKRLSQEVFQF